MISQLSLNLQATSLIQHKVVEAATIANPGDAAGEGSAIRIELSPAAQARLMKSQGQDIPQIALKLRLDEYTVGRYIDQVI